MSDLRASILTREFPPDVYGGAGVHVTFLVRELARLIDVDVQCMGEPRPGATAHSEHDERLTGRRHRYGYSVGFDGGALGDSVLKHDTVAGTTQERRLGAGRLAGEMVFVPSSADAAEDDGVLMGYAHDRARGLTDLVLLDAGTLDDVATVHLPGRVPAGFHGSWAPTAS